MSAGGASRAALACSVSCLPCGWGSLASQDRDAALTPAVVTDATGKYLQYLKRTFDGEDPSEAGREFLGLDDTALGQLASRGRANIAAALMVPRRVNLAKLTPDADKDAYRAVCDDLGITKPNNVSPPATATAGVSAGDGDNESKGTDGGARE